MPPANTSVCTQWATVEDMCGSCADWADNPPDTPVLNRMLTVASELLFERTNRRWPGVCETTVRPCRRNRTSFEGSWYNAWAGSWSWAGGAWGWCGCGGHPERGRCGCPSVPEISLGADQIVDVLEVWADGELLPETAYAVHDDRWLVRVDGEPWPCCQDLLGDPHADEGTFEVTFTYGAHPPEAGVLAASVLACELALACSNNAKCRLPRRVQTVVRQDVTMTILDPLTLLTDGLIGIPEVDLFLQTYTNKYLKGGRGYMLSPDVRRPIRRVSQLGGS